MNAGAARPLRALLIATIVAPVMLFAGAAYTNYTRSFDDARDRLVRDNDILYEHATKVFETHSLVLQQVVRLIGGMSDEQIRGSEKRLHDDLSAMIAGFPQIKDVFVHDRHGLPLVSTGAYPVPHDLSVADRDYFIRQADRDSGVFVSRIFSGRLARAPFFTLTQRRAGRDGSFQGIISVSIHPEYFERFYREIAQAAGGSMVAALARADGALLVRYPPLADPVTFSATGDFARNIAAHPDRDNYQAVSEIDHTTSLFAYRKLPNLPIYVFLAMPRSAVIHAWARQMASHLIYGIPATLGLFLITLIALRRTRSAAEELARREQAEAALRQAQKLEAIGQLTGGIAHDFNNLLAVISGSVQLLRRHAKEPAKFLDAIERAARRGERLTRQLLTFSRQRRTKPAVIDLKDRLPRVIDMLARSVRGDIRIRLQIADDLWRVDLDGDELELALLNLAVNAQDAMPQGGMLTVSAANATLTPDSNDGTGLTGSFVVLSVCDTGQGMTPDVAARAFEPFFTTKPPGKGSGLGLSQVYGFAHHCGGMASLQSTPGQGTCIILHLPKAQRTVSDEIERAPERSPAADIGDLTVLLVEDDPEVRETTAALLEDIGCRVMRASQAVQAQEILATSAPKIDLVLSDVVMPESISGIELARDVRAKYPDLPVVLMTGYSAAAGAVAGDGQPILFKPFSRAQLEEVVREYTGTRQLSLIHE
ncbi:MAG TPA: ATP-binding protein [Alphaproteobacteria bacterium]|nr:ATP-binding protein [Alphaproteobacteria bacterium]